MYFIYEQKNEWARERTKTGVWGVVKCIEMGTDIKFNIFMVNIRWGMLKLHKEPNNFHST